MGSSGKGWSSAGSVGAPVQPGVVFSIHLQCLSPSSVTAPMALLLILREMFGSERKACHLLLPCTRMNCACLNPLFVPPPGAVATLPFLWPPEEMGIQRGGSFWCCVISLKDVSSAGGRISENISSGLLCCSSDCLGCIYPFLQTL